MLNQPKERPAVTVAKNSVYIIGAQILCKVLTFFFYIIIARYFGDEALGKYAFILNLIGMFIITTNFGLDNLIVRNVAVNHSDGSIYLGDTLIIKFFMAVLAIITLHTIMPITGKSPEVLRLVYFYSIVLFTEGISTAIEAIFNAFEKLKYIAVIDITVNVLKLGMGWLIIINKLSLTHLVAGITLLSGIRTLTAFAIYKYNYGNIVFNLKFDRLKQLLTSAYPFAFMGIIAVVYFRIDSIMLSLMKPDEQVGWYSAAFNILAVLTFISYGFSRALFPLLSRLYRESTHAFLKAGERSFNFLIVIGLPISLCISLLADKIILLIYGNDFVNAIPALRLLVWTVPLIYMNAPLLRILYSSGLQKVAMSIGFLTMLFNLTLNFLLIPAYGYMGASFSTLLSEIITFFLYYIVIYRRFSYAIKISAMTLKAPIAFGVMGVFMYYFRDYNLFLLISLSAILYLSLLYLTKAFQQQDLLLIKSAFLKRHKNNP